MINPTDDELVAEFVGYHRLAVDAENILCRQGAEWAPDFLGELAYDDPARCWRVAKLIASSRPSEEALMYLGIALSSLLREHPEIIGTIESDSKANHERIDAQKIRRERQPKSGAFGLSPGLRRPGGSSRQTFGLTG